MLNSDEQALLQLTNFTLGPDATFNTEIHKNSPRIQAPQLSQCKKQINHYDKQRRILMANSTVCQRKWKPIAEPRRAQLLHLREDAVPDGRKHTFRRLASPESVSIQLINTQTFH